MCGCRETPEWCSATIVGVGVFPRLLGELHGPCHVHAVLSEFTSFGQMALPSSLVLR